MGKSLPLTECVQKAWGNILGRRKKNCDEYEPGTLTSLQRSIQRSPNTHGSQIGLIQGGEFKLSREVLSAKRKQLVVPTECTSKSEKFLFMQIGFHYASTKNVVSFQSLNNHKQSPSSWQYTDNNWGGKYQYDHHNSSQIGYFLWSKFSKTARLASRLRIMISHRLPSSELFYVTIKTTKM